MNTNSKYICLLFILSSSLSFAQSGNVGINTANPQGIFHIDGGKDNGTVASPTPAQLQAQQANDFIVKGNAITNSVQVGVGNTNPQVKFDVRAADGSNSAIGFGASNLIASAAGSGAIRYNALNSGQKAKIEYSNKKEWIPLWNSSFPPKVVVIATKTDSNVKYSSTDAAYNTITTQTGGLSNNGVNYMVSWNKIFDGIRNADGTTTNTTTFDATNGYFTAPRDGNYVASFTYSLAPLQFTATSNPLQIEAVWRLFDNTTGWVLATNLVNSVKCANSYSQGTATNLDAGMNCTATFHMTQGQRLIPYTWFNLNDYTGSTKNPLNLTGGYNNLTIVEQ